MTLKFTNVGPIFSACMVHKVKLRYDEQQNNMDLEYCSYYRKVETDSNFSV